MAQNDVIKRLEIQASTAENLITVLKDEIADLSATISATKNEKILENLRAENKILTEKVFNAKEELIGIQKKNGVEQVELPKKDDKISATGSEKGESEKHEAEKEKNNTTENIVKVDASKSSEETSDEKSIDIGRLDMRMGRILEIDDHPDGDNLYIETIDVGEKDPRQVVSGLRKHLEKHEMLFMPVICVCNLKPVKIRGLTSYAMVMCAVKDKDVEPLWPPVNAEPGEPVIAAGIVHNPDKQIDARSDFFKTAIQDLWVNEENVVFLRNKSVPLVVKDRGVIKTKRLKNCTVA